MNVSDERLIAFVDGELSGEERAAMERALAADEVLRQRLEAHQRLRQRLSSAFDPALDEPVPERLRLAAEAPAGIVVQLADHRRARWSVREYGAMAASLAAGLVLGVMAIGGRTPAIVAGEEGLQARGVLAQALERQLAAEQSSVRIGLTFQRADGAYCRTFEVQRTAGLACREDGGWNVTATAESGATGEIRTAASPPAILEAAEAAMAGAPMDAQAERQARDAGWR